jgi:two-component system sensor histidine kinase QseC
LRLRFFLVSLAFLLVTALSITSLLAFYYRSERLSFLDDQIRETATSIVDSRLSEIRNYDYSEANRIISDELGPDRIGKFFIVRTDDGKILFQTETVRLLNINIPRAPTWISIDLDDRLIRILNLKLPRVPNRTLQVGLITDSNFIFWRDLTTTTMSWIAGLLAVLLVITWTLSRALFAPVKRVGEYLRDAQSALELAREVPPLPSDLVNFTKNRGFSKYDEFTELVNGIQQLGKRINLNTKFTRSWTFQMAHELKTPLTILNRDIEDLAIKHSFDKKETADVGVSLNRISNTITNFLNWAEVASTATPTNLHVYRVQSVLPELTLGWRKLFNDRLIIEADVDFQVMSNPFHLSQLIDNLVVNALKYSTGTVRLSFKSQQVCITDEGGGIPRDVLDRVGSPFNKGPSTTQSETGSGLGLAWVKTIADLYSWKMKIDSTSTGTIVEINFPDLSLAEVD